VVPVLRRVVKGVGELEENCAERARLGEWGKRRPEGRERIGPSLPLVGEIPVSLDGKVQPPAGARRYPPGLVRSRDPVVAGVHLHGAEVLGIEGKHRAGREARGVEGAAPLGIAVATRPYLSMG